MGVITGITGSVAWAGSGENAQLATTGAEGQEFRLNLNGVEFDSTNFSTTGASTHVKGLSSWDGEFTGIIKAINHGALGLVTYSAGYVVNMKRWTMNIERDTFDSTVFGATEMAFAPGCWKFGGDFSGFLDDTTVATMPVNSNEPATGTFKYEEKGVTDNTLSGSIFTTRAGIQANPRALNEISYTYRGSGAITQSTPSAGAGILPAGAVAGDAASQLTLTSSTSRTFVGSAFWKSISIDCSVADLVKVRVGFQGTGALVIS